MHSAGHRSKQVDHCELRVATRYMTYGSGRRGTRVRGAASEHSIRTTSTTDCSASCREGQSDAYVLVGRAPAAKPGERKKRSFRSVVGRVR